MKLRYCAWAFWRRSRPLVRVHLSHSGAVSGNGGSGGAGVLFSGTTVTFNNSGAVTGGIGGSTAMLSIVAVLPTLGTSVSNSGLVSGDGGNGGNGGAGVVLAAPGATCDNADIVTGGAVSSHRTSADTGTRANFPVPVGDNTGAMNGSDGVYGLGGIGVTGANLNNANGTISGGIGRANAIGSTTNFTVPIHRGHELRGWRG